MQSIQISVVMPAYNAQKYISQAVESILDQTFKDFELIIVDDCSTDETAKIIKTYEKKDARIIYLKNDHNLKLSKTLNKGIEKAKGKYIARMDADDISLPERLDKQFKYMEKHPDVGISGGVMEIVDSKGKKIGKRTYYLNDREIRKHIFLFSPFSHPLVIIRKSILDKIGYYDDDFNPAEDYELYFRIGGISHFGNLNDILLKYRVVPKSMTTGTTKKMEMQTIRTRFKYASHPRYQFKPLAKFYTYLHLITLYLLPSQLNGTKMWLFNFLRNTK